MTSPITYLPRQLAGDERGAALVEFALVAPVMCLLLAGAFDAAHTLYMRSTLQGIVQKTGRDSSLETGGVAATQSGLDEKVRKQVRALANNATIDFSRRYYRTFSKAAAAQAETWTDSNSNGVCDNSEPYQDGNNNSTWDKDGGDAGQGGAKDKTVYTVTVSYPRMLPIYNWIGGSKTTKISAATVLANQPFGDQGTYGSAVVRNCPPGVLAAPTPSPTPTPAPTPAPAVTPPSGTCTVKLLGLCLL